MKHSSFIDYDLLVFPNKAFCVYVQKQSKAKEMVSLAEKMRLKLLSGSNNQNSGAEDEEMGTKDMQDWLLSVGIVSPVTKESAGALYHQQLSRQVRSLFMTDHFQSLSEAIKKVQSQSCSHILFEQARIKKF